jgi:hypothetical protein
MLAISFVPKTIIRIISTIVAGFAVGAFRATIIVRDREELIRNIGQTVTIRATVTDMSEQKNSQTRLKLKDIYLNYSTKQLKSQIYATLAGEYKEIQRSDQIILRAKMQEGFGEYDASIYRPVIIAVSKPDPPDYSVKIRTAFTSRLRKFFNNSITADLALGFLIGEKTLPQNLKEQLRIVGLSHVVVASGFSLSILANFARK